MINEEVNVLRNNNWMNFTKNIETNPLSSKKFWNRINKLKNDGIEKRSYLPVMNHNNKQYKTDHEKANMFGTILSETFKDNEDEKYDKKFKNIIDKDINDFIKQTKNSNLNGDIINGVKLKKIIKNLKTTLSSGEDLIS